MQLKRLVIRRTAGAEGKGADRGTTATANDSVAQERDTAGGDEVIGVGAERVED